MPSGVFGRGPSAVDTLTLGTAQGIVGGMPWSAVGYATMWAQALGFSDMAAAALTALFWGGTALGNLVGGAVGDLLVKPLPDAGRQITCQARARAPRKPRRRSRGASGPRAGLGQRRAATHAGVLCTLGISGPVIAANTALTASHACRGGLLAGAVH